MQSFDLSDVSAPEPDTLDDVLAIAAEVLAEFGEEAERTRIVRMAEWLVLNVGGEPHHTEKPNEDVEIYTVHAHAFKLVRCGSLFAVEGADGKHYGLAAGTEGARAFAVSLLRACESAEV